MSLQSRMVSNSFFPIGNEAKEARAIAREYRCPEHGKKPRLDFDYDQDERVSDIHIRCCCKQMANTVAGALANEGGFQVRFHWSLIGD